MKMIEVTRDSIVETGPRYRLTDGREVNPRRLIIVEQASGAVALNGYAYVDEQTPTPQAQPGYVLTEQMEQ